MKRREFIMLLGGAAAAWPLAARAQDAGRMRRLGVFSANPREAPHLAAFFDELTRLGFAEPRNLLIEFRRFLGRPDEANDIAAELVKSGVDAIICNGPGAMRIVQTTTQTIPILGLSDDMVAAGLVQSLARPGGNTTGISILAPELDGKRQDILIELVPGARRIATLVDPGVTTPQQIQALETALRSRGIEVSTHTATRPEEIAAAIDAAKAAGAGALNVLAAPLFSVNRSLVIAHTAALRLPAIYQWAEMAEQGGLAAYGPRLAQIYRQLARQVAKVLRGVHPNDIPVEQPTQFELVINVATAKSIGVTLPTSVLLRADQVIE